MSKCFYPYVPTASKQYYRCGRCLGCRSYMRSVWTTRLTLEAMDYDDCAFVTLTYKNSALPPDSTLVKSELTSYVKRLRARLSYPIRYYGCGEYGDRFGRPHYHILLYGLKKQDFLTAFHAWQGKGIVDIDTPASSQSVAAYVSGYVTKKLGKVEEQYEYYNHRLPPFQVQSQGLGRSFIDKMKLYSPFIMIDDKKRWLGRYLTNKAREKFLTLEQIEYDKESVKQMLTLEVLELESRYRDKHQRFIYSSASSPQDKRKYYDLFRFAYNEHYRGCFADLETADSLRVRSTTTGVIDYEPPPILQSAYKNRKIDKIYIWQENHIKVA